MALPMLKEDVRPPEARRNPCAPDVPPEIRVRAEALERKLGRPLRTVIEWPLTEEDEEELVLARWLDDDWGPVDELLKEFGRR